MREMEVRNRKIEVEIWVAKLFYYDKDFMVNFDGGFR